LITKSSITIRPLEPEEYESAVDCIVEARGANYYSSKYYEPAYLQNGKHEIFGAFDENNEIAGITGLSSSVFEKEKTTLSLLNIRPSFTGFGIGTKLLTYTTDLLKTRGARSVKGHVVTRHSSIQKVLEHLELKPAGLLRGIRDGQNATPPIEGKCVLAIYTRSFLRQNALPLFVHKDAAALAARIYSELGVEVSVQTKGQHCNSNTIENYYDAHDDVLFIRVAECGSGLEKNLEKIAKQHRSSQKLTELVFLNLCSPSAIYGYKELLSSAYTFCGFDPLGEFENAVFFKGNKNPVKPEMTECLATLFNEIDKVGNHEYS